LPNELRHQSKIHQLDLSLDAPVQLGKTSRDPIDRQDVDFDPGIAYQGSKFGVREFLAAGPVVVLPHRVVQEAIVSNRRILGMDHRHALLGLRYNTLRPSEHFQVSDLHLHIYNSSGKPSLGRKRGRPGIDTTPDPRLIEPDQFPFTSTR